MDIINSNMTDFIPSPSEWMDLLSWDISQDTELALMKFVSLYHSRIIFTYLPLNLSDRDLKTMPIRPGVMFLNLNSVSMFHIVMDL